MDADDVEFAFKGSRTGRPGASSNQDDYDSEEDEEEEATKSTENPNLISQSFKRQTTNEEIAKAIMAVSASSKPLEVHFMAGSIHGNLGGNLKVVSSGLTSFLNALQTKPIEKLVISTGKQKGLHRGEKC